MAGKPNPDLRYWPEGSAVKYRDRIIDNSKAMILIRLNIVSHGIHPVKAAHTLL